MLTHAQKFRLYSRGFRRKLPLLNNSLIISKRSIKDDGLCYGPYLYKETQHKYILIIVNSNLKYFAQVDTLMHEYAHALLIDSGHQNFKTDKSMHNKEWGIAYSKVYRAFLDIRNEIQDLEKDI